MLPNCDYPALGRKAAPKGAGTPYGNRNDPRASETQPRASPDAQRWRHHGRDHARAGAHRRGSRGLRGHGPRAHPCRHPGGGRRQPYERSRHDSRNPERREHSRHGEVPHWAFRRSADPAGRRGRLHRRVGGPEPGRRRPPYRQDLVRRALRVRRARPRRGLAANRRRRVDDSHERRARHG